MKFVNGKLGLCLRLGAMVAALLLGQQAMALGTAAGVDISNTANVNYKVGGVDQNQLSDTVTFKVDRRVDFLLEPIDTTLKIVAPGEQDAWVDFRLTNTSNSVLDFRLALSQVATGIAVGTGTDGGNLDNLAYAVALTFESGANLDPVQGVDPQYVDEIPADESIRIRVWGDAALALLNDVVAGARLTATAAEPGLSGTEGAALVAQATNDPNLVENVFAEDGDATSNGQMDSIDGWIVAAAELTVAKTFTVIDAGLGTHPIPGAVVEYTITVTNNSATADATDVVITDTLDSNLVFVSNWSGTDDMLLNGVGCTEDSPPVDGCARVGQDLTFTVPTIAQSGGTMTVVFRATIEGSLPTIP